MKTQKLTLIFLLGFLIALPSVAQDGVTRYVRFQHNDGISRGILKGDVIDELEGDDLFSESEATGRTFSLDDVYLVEPINPAKVQKVIGIAINTLGAGREAAVPHPRFFAKMPTSLGGPFDDVELPPEAGNLNYEGELVLVIGKKGRHVSEDDALDYIFGVTAGDDFSENTWYGERNGVEEPTRFISKATDSWAPIGPAIVTGIDYSDLGIVTRLNGEIVQQGRTTELANGVRNLISYISRYVTLMPGDLIFTGTVAREQGSRRQMQAGDVVEVEIENIGLIRNTIVDMMSSN